MKKLLSLSIIGLLAFSACQEKKETPEIDYAIFSGTIENVNSEEVVLMATNYVYKIPIQEDGSFHDTVTIEDHNFFTCRIGAETTALHLAKGDSLHLKINTELFDESIVYEGKGAAENNLLAARYLLNEELAGDVQAIYTQNEGKFIEHIQDVRMKNEKVINESDASDAFKALQLEDARYGFASTLMNYESYHGYFIQNQEYKASDTIHAQMPEFDINNIETYRSSPNFRTLASAHISKKVNATTEDDRDYLVRLNEVMEEVTEPFIKEEIIYNNFEYSLMRPEETLKENYDFLMANTQNETYREEYVEKYERLKKLIKGLPSPTFEDFENHNGGTTSLGDLKGKYTYIDVWATWCGPCKREIPYLKEIEEEYRDKSINFVSISIDRAKDHDTWVDMVNEKELSGVQLMADKDWKSDFVVNYAIDGIPRFILVDPEGNIVSADAPRPSDPGLKELFEELNI